MDPGVDQNTERWRAFEADQLQRQTRALETISGRLSTLLTLVILLLLLAACVAIVALFSAV